MFGRISQKEYEKYGDKIYGWFNPEGEFEERPGRCDNISTMESS